MSCSHGKTKTINCDGYHDKIISGGRVEKGGGGEKKHVFTVVITSSGNFFSYIFIIYLYLFITFGGKPGKSQ